MTITGQTFRDAMSAVATSVAVVTTRDRDHTPHGLTVGSLCSLSLDPPLILFCVATTASAHAALTTADHFVISVLSETQPEVAHRFATRKGNRFRHALPDWHDLPVVPDALVHLLCSRHDQVAAGDHTIVIGRVAEARWRSGRPLLHYRRGFYGLPTKT